MTFSVHPTVTLAFCRMRRHVWRFRHGLYWCVKRLADIVVSLTAIIILSPLFLLIALAVKCSSPGPVFFVQTRISAGRKFRCFKFRSMYWNPNVEDDAVVAHPIKRKNDPRITPIGRFLRRSSLDELPQLVNVLQGAMTLVGPRPPVPPEANSHTLEQRKRLSVKAGLTCLWQISGRSNIPFEQQVRLDNDYIARQSLWLDCRILLKTIPAVLSGRGAY